MDKNVSQYHIGEFGVMLDEAVHELGGYENAHAHLDRAGTLNAKYHIFHSI